jgi:protein-disulfide isomerase
MKSQYVLPITIVVAGVLVAGAVFLVGGGSTPGGSTTDKVTAREYDPNTDYILGNPNAPVKVIEYSDLECPFCKEFQATMHQVMEYYGQSGQVAWVFRHFPLAQLHSKAPQEAQAAECAGELGGNEVFWQYVDRIFEITPGSNGLDLNQLPIVAGELGLDVNAFNACLASNRYAKKVSDSYAEAIALGAQGTPFTLVMVGGEAVTLPGNQPYDSMRAAIDAILVGLPGEAVE